VGKVGKLAAPIREVLALKLAGGVALAERLAGIPQDTLAAWEESLGVQAMLDPGLPRLRRAVGVRNGQRRWAAAIAADCETIPCIVCEVDDDEALMQAGLENIQRDNLTPIEVAQWLAGVGSTRPPETMVFDLCELVGKSEKWVEQYLALVELPADVAKRVTGRGWGNDKGGLTEHQARALHELEGDDPRARSASADSGAAQGRQV